MMSLLPPRTSTLSPRDIPAALLKTALFGAVFGPAVGVIYAWLFDRRWDPLWNAPATWLFHGARIGATYALLFYALCAVPAGYVRQHFRNLGSPACHIATAVVGLAGAIVASVLIQWLVPETTLDAQFFRVSVVAACVAVASSIALAAWDRLKVEKELAGARAQSKVLQAQINPHFFFNTLNTVSALIPVDPEAAQRTLGLLADLSRYAFHSMDSDLVPVARELEFAAAYLEIEKVRFGDRLRYVLPDAADVDGLAIPVLTLQPLLENAVRHGIARRVDGGTILVRIGRSGARFFVAVDNDGDADADLSDARCFRPGHALAIIRERLRLAYGNRAAIELTSPRPGASTVTVHVPLPS